MTPTPFSKIPKRFQCLLPSILGSSIDLFFFLAGVWFCVWLAPRHFKLSGQEVLQLCADPGPPKTSGYSVQPPTGLLMNARTKKERNMVMRVIHSLFINARHSRPSKINTFTPSFVEFIEICFPPTKGSMSIVRSFESKNRHILPTKCVDAVHGSGMLLHWERMNQTNTVIVICIYIYIYKTSP